MAKLSEDPQRTGDLLRDSEAVRALMVEVADWVHSLSQPGKLDKRMHNGLGQFGIRSEAADPLVRAAVRNLNDMHAHVIEAAKLAKNFAAVVQLYEETVQESAARLRSRPQVDSLHVN